MQSSSKYNPLIHHRRSIRLKGYDYSSPGLYFITSCVHGRQCLFGNVVDGEMQLSEYGCIAHEQWSSLNQRFPHIELYEFQIMPNHMHGIVNVGATLAVAPIAVAQHTVENGESERAGASPAPTAIGNIIGAYKSLVANECLKIHKSNYPDNMMGKLWQRNFYEHIIRDETSYHRIRNYIINNPAKWHQDKFNPSIPDK